MKTSMTAGGIHLRGNIPLSTVSNHHVLRRSSCLSSGEPPAKNVVFGGLLRGALLWRPARLSTPGPPALQVLHMNEGLGETSYASNSLMQSKIISMTRPIIEEAMEELYGGLAPAKTICIADLGCSSGPNCFSAMKDIVRIVDRLRQKHGHALPDFTLHLNDLPGTDFNSIFRVLLPRFLAELKRRTGLSNCFVNGVPGSFNGRLFAAQTLHFVHSSNTLHWLSKVPDGLETYNKDNICITSTSTEEVIRAYYTQFQKDFLGFLQSRSMELVNGGKMVLTILGRRSHDASRRESLYIYELIGIALKEMASEGLIEEEKLRSFNIPIYTPSAKELEMEVVKEGSFVVGRLEISEIKWESCGSQDGYVNDEGFEATARCMRSVTEPLLVEHFGFVGPSSSIIDRLFEKYKNILARMSEEDTEEYAKLVNITLSMTKK